MAIILTLAILTVTGCAFAEGQRGNGGPGGNGGMDQSGNVELQAILVEMQDKFQLLAYEDAETGPALR